MVVTLDNSNIRMEKKVKAHVTMENGRVFNFVFSQDMSAKRIGELVPMLVREEGGSKRNPKPKKKSQR